MDKHFFALESTIRKDFVTVAMNYATVTKRHKGKPNRIYNVKIKLQSTE